MERAKNGLMAGWCVVDRWMDGEMDGWMDEWMEECNEFYELIISSASLSVSY